MVGHTIETTCSMNDEDVPCPDKVMPGVVAKTKCKLGYKAADSKSTVKSKCMDDGTWERAAVVCLPKCGIFKKQFVVAGANKTNSVMPWHVLIYRQGLYVCGGTIITDRLVLSAKSCFYEFYNEFPVNEFSVLVGKTKFDLTKSELGTQSFAIEKTHKYLGYYEGDIILMTLDKRIQFNDHIMPICIDLKSSKEAPVGQTGKISAPTGACNGNEFLDTFDLKALDKNDYQEEARKLFISPGKTLIL